MQIKTHSDSLQTGDDNELAKRLCASNHLNHFFVHILYKIA